MLVFLFRHFATEGNRNKQYIGVTDQSILPLNAEEEKQLLLLQNALRKEEIELIFHSPMKRCIETARLLFPDRVHHRVEGFTECNFGLFEGKNYQELNKDRHLSVLYQKWIDSGGRDPFPEGDDPIRYKEKILLQWYNLLEEVTQRKVRSIALILHGGSIRAILDRDDLIVRNGEMFQLTLTRNKNAWKIMS